jgi:hypothetical protein
MPSYSDVEAVVLHNLGRTDATTKAMVLAAFNTSLMLIATSGQWDELQKKVIGFLASTVDKYNIQVHFGDTFYKLETLKFRDAAGKWHPPISIVTPTKWDEAIQPYHKTDPTNMPTVGMIYQGELSVDPTPDRDYAYEARIYILPSRVLPNTNPTLVFPNLESVFVNSCTGLVWSALEETTLASFYLTMADNIVKGFLADQRSSINFSALASHKNAGKTRSSEPWADPFQRSNK